MRPSEIIPEDAQQHFWAVVEQCLREFHPLDSGPSVQKMRQLQERLLKVPIEEFELFFHSEPFGVACALAGQRLKVEDYLSRYLEIRDVENALTPN
jgi:hypothetical protein